MSKAYGVDLYAYDLANPTSTELPVVSGAWHLSVKVYRKEYSYGPDGISIKSPGSPHAVEIMGVTGVTKEELEDYLDDIEEDWMGCQYNVLTHNCQDFAELVLNYLRVSRKIPRIYQVVPKATNAVAGPFGGLLGKILRSPSSTK